MARYPIYNNGIRTSNRVALTFDDGPNPPRTEQILEVLAAAGVHATFFLLGKWVERYPRTVDRILAGGHLIGNHGYDGQGRIGDYDAAEIVIGHATGQPSRYLRPHTGNMAAYAQSFVASLPESRLIGGEVSAHDWQMTLSGTPILSADEVVRAVLENPALGPGAIIVCHDGAEWLEPIPRLRRPLPTVAALPRIIAGLQERGLEPVRVDELELDDPVEWDPIFSGDAGAIDAAERENEAQRRGGMVAVSATH